jgi:hypothetical protein
MRELEPLQSGQIPGDSLLLEAGQLIATEVQVGEAAQVGEQAGLHLAQKVPRKIWNTETSIILI